MLLDQRREEILQIIESKGFVSLQELVELLGASESTIRRDLEYLDSIGQIRRTRGGATYIGEHITPFEVRRAANQKQKQRIAECLVADLTAGDAILLDGGTTTLEVARRLAGKSLQVVTNSVPIAQILVNHPEIELILIGGYVYPRTGVALGPLAEQALEHLRVTRLILSAGGITERGLFNSNSLLVECERKMLAAADQVWLAADSSKFGRSALVHLCALSAVTRLYSDDGLTEGWRQIVRAAGVELKLATTAGGASPVPGSEETTAASAAAGHESP
ncbi:MAG: DeoR family transcriptional regulator [Planctomycetaceae bacterium]|nr:MAG: DeoR family transcriptional regulator [Planctomycetaceae bacterium]